MKAYFAALCKCHHSGHWKIGDTILEVSFKLLKKFLGICKLEAFIFKFRKKRRTF